MIKIAPGVVSCWQDFSLLIEQELFFMPDNIYYLQGENGSGKSSFIRHCLFPALASKKILFYQIYLQQLFHLQGYAIKSHSAFYKPELKLKSDWDCIQYLFSNLAEIYAIEPKPVYCIVDENRYLAEIYRYLKESCFPFCLIFCEHSSFSVPEEVNIVNFQLLAPNRSSVYETTI